MGERTERERAAALIEHAQGLQRPAARGSGPAPGLTRATEGRIGKAEKRQQGGLVRGLESAGIILLFLGAVGIIVAVFTMVARLARGGEAGNTDLVVAGLGGAWSLILAGAVFLWMGEVLWRLRRIDDRGRGES